MSDLVKKPTLQQIISEARLQNQELIDNLGELTPELQASMELNQENLSSKVDGYYFRLQDLENQLGIIKEIKKQADSGIKVLSKNIDFLKNNMKLAMEVYGFKVVLGNYSKFTLQKTKKKLVIDDLTKIPMHYLKLVEVIEVDKDTLYKDLQNGVEIQGAHLEENEFLRPAGNNRNTIRDVEPKKEIEE